MKQWPTITTTTIFLFTLFRYKGKDINENTRNYRKRNDRNHITICKIFESACNSLSSKTFDLAAAYLQVKKGTKEKKKKLPRKSSNKPHLSKRRKLISPPSLYPRRF